MITFEEAMNAKALAEVAELSAANLDQQDMVNLILQRSEIIQDQKRPHSYIKHWTAGNEAPIFQLVEEIGQDELLRRAAAFIYLEYQQLKPHLSAPRPKKIADIGCGYALFDLFLAREYDTKIILIDIESNERRHFGFEEEGAAYSSLSQAKTFLMANGVKESRITTINPQKEDLGDLKSLDYIFSFISCGFHYPWDTYLSFYQQALRPSGRVILDVRARIFSEVFPQMARFGSAKFLTKAAHGSADRIMLTAT